MPSRLSLLPILLPFLLASTNAQSTSTTSDGCLRLSGSVACPGFANAYLNPANLTNAFPFFADVTDVNSFDAGALEYFSDPNQFKKTKFTDQLGCTNASSVTIRYARTVLCSMWVNEKWSIQCFDRYNSSQIATGPKMVCQDTCLAYSANEQEITQNPEYCPTDNSNGTRLTRIAKDFSDCTNWATLATMNASTCVSGDVNEGSCGFGSSTDQLCAFCNVSNPDACCSSSATSLTPCGFSLATISSITSAASSASATAAQSSSAQFADRHSGLSGGQIAGIVVGSVVGGLLLLGLLLLLLVCGGCLAIGALGRRQKEKRQSKHESFTAAGATPHLGSSNQYIHSPNASSGGPMSERTGAASSQRTMVPNSTASLAGSNDKLMKPKNAAAAGAGAVAGLGLGAALGPQVGAAGAAPGRTLLKSVRDENQSGEHLILPNSTVTVLWPYTAALADELTLKPGMKLQVLRIYDDAWGTGQVVEGDTPGKQGAFPLVCVTENNSEDSPGATSENDALRWSGSQ